MYRSLLLAKAGALIRLGQPMSFCLQAGHSFGAATPTRGATNATFASTSTLPPHSGSPQPRSARQSYASACSSDCHWVRFFTALVARRSRLCSVPQKPTACCEDARKYIGQERERVRWRRQRGILGGRPRMGGSEGGS